MSWLRVDDHELHDPRVGRLTDAEYRARAALMQYVAREGRGAGGLFERSELDLIVWATPKGPRSISTKEFERFLQLGLVRPAHSYSLQELAEMRSERGSRRLIFREAAEEIEKKQANGNECFRFNSWEVYNGARDRTVNERQASWRERHGKGRGIEGGV